MCSRFAAICAVKLLQKATLAVFFFKGVDLIQYFDIHFSTSLSNYTEIWRIKKGRSSRSAFLMSVEQFLCTFISPTVLLSRCPADEEKIELAEIG